MFKERREVAFSEIFDKSEGRYGLIGTLIALLENGQQADGSVVLPEPLVAYGAPAVLSPSA